MSRTRTAPETRPAISTDRLKSMVVTMEYNDDGSVNRDSINFIYSFESVDADNKVYDSFHETINIDQWPATAKADIKSLRDKVMVDAQNKGRIKPGTDTDDMQ